MAKKVLIVYAHQSSSSFNAAAKNIAVEVLTAQGCTVEVSDLYAMGFKATATAEDIKGDLKDAENFCYLDESKLAWEQGRLSDDITKEQSKLTEADLVIFQFPMYWFSVPGILKGWFDRVLTNGFAFSQKKPYGLQTFKDKKVMLSVTTGSPESMFCTIGINGDINVTLWPLQNGILHYCGFQLLSPEVFWAPALAAAEDRKKMLESWRTRLQGLLEEEPLSFTPLYCFDKKTFQLKYVGEEFGLSVGIHRSNPRSSRSQMKD
ncbi:PREDICTED: ribosyldihydronicotinamide dehydrogenase [quinone]-like [Poecilia mexicana]|uniref:Ribosyldihydronicotinamide dehydrogenase [quinone] n=1 Tax=Poecilia mexicana TaxID=48701 RepID=A0A3B3YF39_9TELE|nr:PREDICTED: ribosyldihydronicotinamide dehydrogenase [quinone]-like [Poecilia mexicana]